MIQNSFIFLDKIGAEREKRIWQQGIKDWNDFAGRDIDGISGFRKKYYERQLSIAKNRLAESDEKFFSKVMPHAEQWRLYDEFKEDAVFLDIETSGYYGYITVIGLYNGNDTMMFVRNKNLDKELLQKVLNKFKLVVTFNGSSFDLPIIQKYMGVEFNMPHIDLRHVCAKIGLTGGLKHIEKVLGIKRPEEVENMQGADAVYLWQNYMATQESRYLEKLIKYNEEDIINLKPLAEHAVQKLWKNTFRPNPGQPL